MVPAHHPPATDLLLYAAGVGDPGLELLLAAHCTVCPRCRDEVARAEAVGGGVLLEADAAPMEVHLERVLARLDEGGVTPLPAPPRGARVPRDEVFPAPLRQWVGGIAEVPWRTVAPGMRIARVPIPSERRVFLVDFDPGTRLPAHGHHGVERAMPMRGGFSDERSHYGPGDVSWHGGDDHRVHIDADGPCTCLFVTDGPLAIGGRLGTALVDRWLHA